MFFYNIEYAYIFIIAPIVILFFALGFIIRKKSLSNFFSSGSNDKKKNKAVLYYRIASSFIFVFIFILLSISVLRPKWGLLNTPLQIDATDIVFVLDLSTSMNTADVKPSRLERTKYEIIDFIKRTENIRIGLVVFAGSNFIASPITYDKDSFISLLNSLTPNSMSIQGTRIGDALDTAKNVFIEDEAKRSLIIITDGEDHEEGSTSSIADKLRDENISVYAVAIGTKEGEAVPSFDEKGRRIGYKKTTTGMPVISKRNDALIEDIARKTGGEFFVSENGTIPFNKIYESIRNTTPQKKDALDMKYYGERYQIFVFIALMLLALEIILSLAVPALCNKTEKNIE